MVSSPGIWYEEIQVFRFSEMMVIYMQQLDCV